MVLVRHQHRLSARKILIANAVWASVMHHHHPLRRQTLDQCGKSIRNPGTLPRTVVGRAVLQNHRLPAGSTNQLIDALCRQRPVVHAGTAFRVGNYIRFIAYLEHGDLGRRPGTGTNFERRLRTGNGQGARKYFGRQGLSLRIVEVSFQPCAHRHRISRCSLGCHHQMVLGHQNALHGFLHALA